MVELDTRDRPAADPARAEEIRLHQAFLGRVVDYLCADAGVRQFVDWGCPVPGTTERIREAAPETRVVHVAPEGTAGVLASSGTATALSGDGSGTRSLLRRLRDSGLVDFGEPVAVLMTRPFPSGAAPDGLGDLRSLMRGGGYLALTSTAPRAELERAFDPFRTLEPGVADLTWWPYPDEDVPDRGCGILAGLGRVRERGRGTSRWR